MPLSFRSGKPGKSGARSIGGATPVDEPIGKRHRAGGTFEERERQGRMGRTYDNTYAAICDRGNIRAALDAAAKGKRHKRAVKLALAHEDETVERIRDTLVNHKPFLPEVRQGHEINDGIRLKKRIIVHPSFTEQIIDHAMMQVLEPHFERKMYRWSCGSIPGRGQEDMSKYICRMVAAHPEKCKYFAVMDVKSCFPSTWTDAVYAEIAKIERDPKTLQLVRYKLDANRIRLESGAVIEGGIPIGLYTSPWFVNLALTPFDHTVKDDCGIYLMVRFMDDIMMAHGNKREFKRAIEAGTVAIARFGLSWKKRPVVTLWLAGDMGKIRFCGAHFMKDGSMELHDKIFIRARRTVNRIDRKRRTGRRVTWYDASKVVSYSGRFAAFGSWNAFGPCVLQDKVRLFDMRQKISAHDRLLNNSQKRKETLTHV